METLKTVCILILSIHILTDDDPEFCSQREGEGGWGGGGGGVSQKQFDKKNALILLLIRFIFHTKCM